MSQTWGVIPAAGLGTRIQPLAFSKELLPVGSRMDADQQRPRAVSEHLVERMILAGATRLCFVVSPGKTDIMQYFGGQFGPAAICYVVQQDPKGLCDALFTALPFISPEDEVLVAFAGTAADTIVLLPPATGSGRPLDIKKVDANPYNIGVTPAGADTVDDGSGPFNILARYAFLYSG